jgi:hypothetical protein
VFPLTRYVSSCRARYFDADYAQVAELVQELPPKPFADRVIDWFFSGLNYVRYPIDERLFRICKS